jgi:hypothetical protein
MLNPLVKVLLMQYIMTVIFTGFVFSQGRSTPYAVKATGYPVFPPDTSRIEELKQSLEPLLHMSIDEVIAEVPTASGIYFVGCPHCNGGAQESEVLSWQPGMGDKVKCNYCSMVFPNEKYPNNREKVIISPSGERQVYRYYENPEGRQFEFEPHAWYERWTWIQSKAVQLAKVWYVTHDNAYGDRAAAIAGRFAQVFPDYAIRFDYPNEVVKFFPADQKWPYDGLTPYRGAKWSWWGYMDIPVSMMKVYDILMGGYDWTRMDKFIGKETSSLIREDLLRLGYEFTAINPEVYSNMSPGMYRDMIQVGRVLGDPAIVHDAVKRFREFFSKGFFADGWWKEGTTSYHDQTIGGLKTVIAAISGYVDPVDWKGERFENINLENEVPLYRKALAVSLDAVLPNGRKIPINDTWGNIRKESRRVNTTNTGSHLWPSLGNALLGAGEGDDRIMLNVNWSGNYGHSHYDNGSIILYAAGEELLSDIGYTHTRYRGWTINTASHNTVVIDQMGQDAGSVDRPVTGRLKFYDDSDAHVKAIDIDASPAYSKSKTYRRRLLMIHAGPGRDYIVDRFDVEGGSDHDWFLHGMCEEKGILETSVMLEKPVETLVPSWGVGSMPKTQYDTDPKRFHPYGYMRDVKTGPSAESWTATWKYAKTGLRTHILLSEGSQIFRFSSPSLRQAGENEQKLDDFMHNGVMLRHSCKASTFLAVHEPFRNGTWIESVKTDGPVLVVRYILNGSATEDRVKLSDDEIMVTSSSGWKYYSGKQLAGTIKGLENVNGKYRLLLDRKVTGVNFVRLELSDGGTRCYPVANVNGKWIELMDDPGFTIEADGSRIKFHTFPHDQHAGPLRYTVFVSSSDM